MASRLTGYIEDSKRLRKQMVDTLIIFIAGLGGVFLGMALLYISIRVTSLVTGGFDKKRKKND